MLRQPLADRRRQRRRACTSGSVVSTPGGGGGTATPKMLSSSHLPRSTGEVRSGYDVVASSRAVREQPAALLGVGQRDAAEAAAVDARESVVPRQPLVDERVVGAQQIRARCDPRAACCATNSSVSCLKASSRLSSKSRIEIRMDDHFVDAPQVQPLRGEVVDERVGGARIGQHPPHLLLEHRRLGQLAALGQVEQALVGNAAPQEERQPRGDLESLRRYAEADAVRPADRDERAAGSPDRPACARARTGCRRRSCRRRAGRRRRTSSSVSHVGGRHRPAIGEPRDPRQDPGRRSARSSAAACGWQTKIARRLGVSVQPRRPTDTGRRSGPSRRSRSPCRSGRS